MIKSGNYLSLAWEVIIVLFLTSITGYILILLPSFHLKNLINNSAFLWFIYFYIPSILTIIYGFFKSAEFVRFSFFIEFKKWYRYLLIVIIIVGLVSITISLVSNVKLSPVLLYIDIINTVTRKFSYLFYIKMILLAPLIEELIFRGLILDGFLTKYKATNAIVLSSLVFAFFHFNLYQIGYTFLLGLLCGWYYYKTRNLLTCMIIHSFNNLTGIIVIKHFMDKLRYHPLTSDTKLFQIDNLLLVILSSATLIIVGGFYLYYSMNLKQLNHNKDRWQY